jgi:hypothetical protein
VGACDMCQNSRIEWGIAVRGAVPFDVSNWNKAQDLTRLSWHGSTHFLLMQDGMVSKLKLAQWVLAR